MSAVARGEKVQPPFEVHFAQIGQMLAVFTPRRWELIAALRESGPLNVAELAGRLCRDAKNVHYDLAELIEWMAVERMADGRMQVPWAEIVVDITLPQTGSGEVATGHPHLMSVAAAQDRLAAVIRVLAALKRDDLDRLKDKQSGIERPDFVWRSLLQSFSTMGRASGWHGLIEKMENYNRVTYAALEALSGEARHNQVHAVCRAAGIRMPDRKAGFILACFEHVRQLGGPSEAKAQLLSQVDREAKIRFLDAFPGIGPKYARNIMMDVYHEDFRDSIAIDLRIKAITEMLGLAFSNYAEHEAFYLEVARKAGVNGWELDRLLFNFHAEVEKQLT